MTRPALVLLGALLPSLVGFVALSEAAPQPPGPDEPATTPRDEDVAEATAATLPSLDDLRAPTSPAFVLLGVAPTSIERPATPQALVASLLSTVQQSEGIPENLALSIAPYWLRHRPAMKWDELFDARLSARTFLRTLSISVASTRPDEDEEGDDASPVLAEPALSVGFRGLLVGGGGSGKMKEKIRTQRAELAAKLSKAHNAKLACIIEAEDNEGRANSAAEESEKAGEEAERAAPEARAAAEAKALAADVKKVALELVGVQKARSCEPAADEAREKARREAALAMADLSVQRVGFTLELAGGAAWVFPGDAFEARELQRWGAWLTSGYRWVNSENGQAIGDILGVARYLREKGGHESESLDLGGRLVWHANPQMAFSAEYVRRLPDQNGSQELEETERLVAMLEYQIGENSYLFATYGKDFEAMDGDRPLVSTAGFKLALGQKPRVSID